MNFLRSRYIYTPGLVEDWGAEQTLAKFQFINRVSNGGNIPFNENNKYPSAESFLPDGILKNGTENIFRQSAVFYRWQCRRRRLLIQTLYRNN